MDIIDITDCKNLKVVKHRWHIDIIVTPAGERPQTWVASADSYDTDGDGIFFGTKDEWEEHRNDL